MQFCLSSLCLLLLISPSVQSQAVEKKTPSNKPVTTPDVTDKNKKHLAPPKPKAKTNSTSSAASLPKGGLRTPTATATPAHEKSSPARVIDPPLISYFNQDSKGWLRAGQMVHITMQGSPGALATFRINGMSESLSMLESAPGQYLANWTVPMGKSVVGLKALVTGDLSLVNKVLANKALINKASANAAPTMQASLPLCIDTVPPSLSNLMPSPQSALATVYPTLSIEYTDEGSGIDVSSVRLILNGRDLTGEASVTTERLVYKPLTPFVAGDQSVEVIVADNAGNMFRQSWHFTVTPK